MRNLLVAVFMILTLGTSYAHDCVLDLQPAGVFYYVCPFGTLADGAEGRPTPNGLYTIVRCVRPVLRCNNIKEDEGYEDKSLQEFVDKDSKVTLRL